MHIFSFDSCNACGGNGHIYAKGVTRACDACNKTGVSIEAHTIEDFFNASLEENKGRKNPYKKEDFSD